MTLLGKKIEVCQKSVLTDLLSYGFFYDLLLGLGYFCYLLLGLGYFCYLLLGLGYFCEGGIKDSW